MLQLSEVLSFALKSSIDWEMPNSTHADEDVLQENAFVVFILMRMICAVWVRLR